MATNRRSGRSDRATDSLSDLLGAFLRHASQGDMVELAAPEEGEGGDVYDLARDGDLGLAERAGAVLQALAGEIGIGREQANQLAAPGIRLDRGGVRW